MNDHSQPYGYDATTPVADRQTGIALKLIGTDGNAFSVLGKAQRALRRAGVDPAPFMAEATAGDYDHLLGVVMQWFDVE
ncbi:MAG: hypothetical protein M3Q30_19770 [Actinomycetota bacterium]|nr:hypothetical protein [Actinomycetota bacterium]